MSLARSIPSPDLFGTDAPELTSPGASVFSAWPFGATGSSNAAAQSMLGLGQDDAAEDGMTPGALARMAAAHQSPEEYRKAVSSEIAAGMAVNSYENGTGIPKDFVRALKGADMTELSMLDDLHADGLSDEGMGEVLDGAHVRVDDGGKLYKQWSETLAADGEAHTRSSSHYAGVKAPQYGVEGQLFKESLFGASSDAKDTQESWMQLEHDPVGGKGSILDKIQSTARHGLGYINYCRTGKNQGPWGESEHTETYEPLLLKNGRTEVDYSRDNKASPGSCAVSNLHKGEGAVKGVAKKGWNLLKSGLDHIPFP